MRSKSEFYDGKMKVARGAGLKSVENIDILKGQMSKTLGKMRVSKLAERIGGTAEALIYINFFQPGQPPTWVGSHTRMFCPPPPAPLS